MTQSNKGDDQRWNRRIPLSVAMGLASIPNLELRLEMYRLYQRGDVRWTGKVFDYTKRATRRMIKKKRGNIWFAHHNHIVLTEIENENKHDESV